VICGLGRIRVGLGASNLHTFPSKEAYSSQYEQNYMLSEGIIRKKSRVLWRR